MTALKHLSNVSWQTWPKSFVHYLIDWASTPIQRWLISVLQLKQYVGSQYCRILPCADYLMIVKFWYLTGTVSSLLKRNKLDDHLPDGRLPWPSPQPAVTGAAWLLQPRWHNHHVYEQVPCWMTDLKKFKLCFAARLGPSALFIIWLTWLQSQSKDD
jgi:hypothetical protein